MKKILIVVDVQKDFYHPDGALYVKGAETLPEKIANILPKFDDAIFTMDWHPNIHCSFKNNGGIWPTHCVAFTEGASLPKEFIPYLRHIKNENYNVVTKGMDSEKEEYGANALSIMLARDRNPIDCEFVFCGIAGNYCVMETIKNFITMFPTVKTSVLVDCVASIDDGTTLRKFMEENNIPEFKI